MTHSLHRRSVKERARSVALMLVLGAGACTASGSEPSAGASAPAGEATGEASAGTNASEAPEPSPLGTIIVSADGCVVDGIESPIAAGPVVLTIVNETDGLAVANMSKILDGGTYEELVAHIAKEIRLASAGKPALGHPSFAPPSFDLFVGPGESGILKGEVTSGTYAIVCGRTFEEVEEVRPSAVLGPYRVG